MRLPVLAGMLVLCFLAGGVGLSAVALAAAGAVFAAFRWRGFWRLAGPLACGLLSAWFFGFALESRHGPTLYAVLLPATAGVSAASLGYGAFWLSRLIRYGERRVFTWLLVIAAVSGLLTLALVAVYPARLIRGVLARVDLPTLERFTVAAQSRDLSVKLSDRQHPIVVVPLPAVGAAELKITNRTPTAVVGVFPCRSSLATIFGWPTGDLSWERFTFFFAGVAPDSDWFPAVLQFLQSYRSKPTELRDQNVGLLALLPSRSLALAWRQIPAGRSLVTSDREPAYLLAGGSAVKILGEFRSGNARGNPPVAVVWYDTVHEDGPPEDQVAVGVEVTPRRLALAAAVWPAVPVAAGLILVVTLFELWGVKVAAWLQAARRNVRECAAARQWQRAGRRLDRAEVPMPTEEYPMAKREFAAALVHVDGEFAILRGQGKPRWFLAAYLAEKNRELEAKFSAQRERALAEFFRQRQAMLEAAAGAYQAHERSKTLPQRTQLQTEAEMATLRAEHLRAQEQVRFAQESERLKYEAEIAALKAKVAEAERQEVSARQISALERKQRRLEAQAEVARLKQHLKPKPEQKKLSREAQLIERLSELREHERALISRGYSPEEAHQIVATAEREIKAEFRLRGS